MRRGGFSLIGNLGLGIVAAIVGGNVLGWLGILHDGWARIVGYHRLT